ncbi:MFS general substrate transporter [Aspergillus sclerotiicarbonarius CBS 121057]|uniref:MFS general substrate transporter n=1 Tax=Aspergillus sclerotiicarbonarius (strain CBS 121057 / IBT 28362) TaxID=1448318 RepID=A0A319EHA0_ASPSB|nr:MFS general substrate transporter [Aspergillus sclerotiicarbonarius CBS 121057]
MKSSRYSTSRQKACIQCSNAKAKCDRRSGNGRCMRCSSEGQTEIDFSNLDLLCPINADDIRNRWIQAYIPVPGQTIKQYPTGVSAFIYQILKSYAAVAVHGRGILPFIHPKQLMTQPTGSPLTTCLSLVRMCSNALPGSADAAASVLHREMYNLYELRERYSDEALFAAFQAYLIYAMILFFRLNQACNDHFRTIMTNLQDLACASSRGGVVCAADQRRARPRWEEWIVAEAKRRTLYVMYLFDSILSTHEGLPTFIGTELSGLPAPANRLLWQAGTRYEWEREYNIHMAEWMEGSLTVDELWPIPDDLGEAGLARLRDRVDRWMENLDEYGTMLYAIMRFKQPPDTATAPPPEPPYSIFDNRQKWLIIIIVSTAATFSGFASNIYFPALPTIANDLNVSVELVDLSVTSYLIFQGLAPSIWGPVSDVRGRRSAYMGTFVVFLGACIGLAETRSYAQLIVLRCLQSTGSASTIAIGSGVIGDITTRAERGGYMGIFQAGLLVPVAVGPVIGGGIAGSLGWKAIFWFLTIYSGVFLCCLVILLPETLRSLVANGSQTPSSPLTRFPLDVYQRTTKVPWQDAQASQSQLAAKKSVNILGPFRMLISNHAAPIIFFLAIYYAVWQMSITAMSSLFESRYGLSEIQIGLTFIANGVGSMIGTLVTGKILDADYRRVKASYEASFDGEQGNDSIQSNRDDDFPLEKARLRLVPVFAISQCLSIILFGWTIQYPHKVPIAIPIISTFITSWTAVSTQSLIMTYLVDIFPDRSAAASASLNLARCLFAAGGTSFIMPMINGVGVGVAFTICVAVQLVALVGPLIQWKFAAEWRKQERDDAARRADVKD